MKNQIRISLRAAVPAALLAGCATLETLQQESPRAWNGPERSIPRLYSGTAFDFVLLSFPNESFALLDLPFSLVADTLVLPWTIYTQLARGNLELVHVAEEPSATSPR